jgi:hypothetical protein
VYWIVKVGCGSAVEQSQERCGRYYERFACVNRKGARKLWIAREVLSKMDEGRKEVEGCQQRRRKKKTTERRLNFCQSTRRHSIVLIQAVVYL